MTRKGSNSLQSRAHWLPRVWQGRVQTLYNHVHTGCPRCDSKGFTVCTTSWHVITKCQGKVQGQCMHHCTVITTEIVLATIRSLGRYPDTKKLFIAHGETNDASVRSFMNAVSWSCKHFDSHVHSATLLNLVPEAPSLTQGFFFFLPPNFHFSQRWLKKIWFKLLVLVKFALFSFEPFTFWKYVTE